PQPTLDLADIFGREAPLVIEIGSGHGESIVAAATAQPDTNFLGFEVFEASIAATLGKISDAGLSNVRLIAADAISGLIHLIEDASVTEILIFFPDPWQKKRHHKRRLVSPGFLDLVSQKLIDGGILRLATDWDSYAQAMRDHLGADPRFALIDEQRFHLRPLTKFESRGIAAGRTIQDMAYQLKARS
ncbi:MAG: tRNA (guanosine(46)-N7)-methyltransferase TrmB, partial [Propionibacteriaceae bacterium]|nr:tRNA (guanosine(46)-N7)-methyltransferase TrmB [Propionibacteriaceae bacterium]